MSGILNEVSDQNIEESIIGICNDSGVDINALDIKGYPRLPFGRNAVKTTKRLIVKFVNRKHSEATLQR